MRNPSRSAGGRVIRFAGARSGVGVLGRSTNREGEASISISRSGGDYDSFAVLGRVSQGGVPIEQREQSVEQVLIHSEIFDETLEECERLLFAAERELEKTRRAAELEARRRTDQLVQATSSAMAGLTEEAEAELAAASAERRRAEELRLDVERSRAALSARTASLDAASAELEAERAKVDAALLAAETYRAEARTIHQTAHGIATALLDAAAVRAALLETTLDDRIAEVGRVLAAVHDLVLEHTPRGPTSKEASLREFLSSTFREIREFREAELSAASRHADNLIARARDVAIEVATQASPQQLPPGQGTRAIIDLVSDAHDQADSASPGPPVMEGPIDQVIDLGDSDDFEPAQAAPPAEGTQHDDHLEATQDLSRLPPPPRTTDAAVRSEDVRPEQTVAEALEHVLDNVDDPGRITDRELAEVLSATDHLVGDRVSITDATDLARSLADALQPQGDDVGTSVGADRSDATIDWRPTPTVGAQPPEAADSLTEIEIDLTHQDGAIVSLHRADAGVNRAGEPVDGPSHQASGRLRTLWQRVFSS